MRSKYVLCVFGLGLFLLSTLAPVALFKASAADKGSRPQLIKVYCKTYRIGDLKVWAKNGRYNPIPLMRRIRSEISPNSWEAFGGPSTMASYPQNTSIVVSTTSENHEKIDALLKKLRQQAQFPPQFARSLEDGLFRYETDDTANQ